MNMEHPLAKDPIARRNIEALNEAAKLERARLDELFAKVESQGATIQTLTSEVQKLRRDVIMARAGAAHSGPTAG